MQETDRLIRRAQNGDMEAYEQLIMPLEQKVYSLCYRITNNREDAFDCAQEVLLRTYRSLGDYQFKAAFSTWIYRIATNVCLDAIRRRKTRPFVSLESLTDKGFPLSSAHLGNPYDELVRRDTNQALKACIAKLPLDSRTALILRDVQGLTYEEVAQILKLNMGTVKSRISRARERLRKLMQEYGDGNEVEQIDRPLVRYVERRKPNRDM